MDEKQNSQTVRERAGEWLKGIGNLRDGLLVAATFLYILGYIVWAINAYRNELGLLPALEFQYFIAGAPPLLITLGLYFILVGEKRLRTKVRAWIGPSPTGGKLYLCWVISFSAILAAALIMTSASESFKATFPNAPRTWLTLISAVIIVVSPLFIGPLENTFDERKLLHKLFKLLHPVIVLYLGFLGLVYALMFFIGFAALGYIYCVDLYPKLPQEFGGARPYYACLDVVKAQMSPETIEGILPIEPSKSHEPVVRSSRLEVLFSGNDVMLVRSRGKVYKIAKSIIQTVAMCD